MHGGSMSREREKIVVTGMGAVTPVGCGVESYWNNLINGECGIDRIMRFDAESLAVKIAGEVKDFDIEAYMPKKMIHETDAFTQYAFAAAKEALGDGLPADPERTGIVMGTAMAGVATTAATSGDPDKRRPQKCRSAFRAEDPRQHSCRTDRDIVRHIRAELDPVDRMRIWMRCGLDGGDDAACG